LQASFPSENAYLILGSFALKPERKKALAEAKTSLTRWWAIRRMRVQVKKILNVFPGISG
jgi:hypothetical protein